MKILKFSAMLFGAAAMITGFNSCKKDEDKCCTISETYDGVRYTYKACEDGTMTYSYTGGETETYDWHDYYTSWAEVKAEFIDEGGSCN